MRLLYPFIVIIFCIYCHPDRINDRSSLYVEGRFLKAPDGEKIILRGVNEMFIWSNDLSGERTFPEIAKTGANVVRIVWLTNTENPLGSPENLDKIISNCIANKIIPIVELHGATGKWDQLTSQVDYWVKPAVVAVLKKHQEYLILNIANEVGGWEIKSDVFARDYKTAINRIRDTGIVCPVMIDASGWGQDIDILQATGKDLIAHDPLHNLLLSVHMWWPKEQDGSRDRIILEIKESVDMNLPIVVGEFAPMGPGCKQYIDFDAILTACQEHEVGWLSWSWGLVNNGDCKDMDMTSDALAGKFEGLFDWGEAAAITHPYSIKNTAKRPDFLK